MSYEPSHRKPPRQERWPSATPGEGWPAYQQGDDGRAWEPVQAFAGSRNGYDAAGNGYDAASNGYDAAGNGYGAAGNGYGAAGNGHGAAGNGYGAAGNGHGDRWDGRGPTADGYGDAWGGARYSDPGQGYRAGGNGYGGTTTAYPAVGDGYGGDGYGGDGYADGFDGAAGGYRGGYGDAADGYRPAEDHYEAPNSYDGWDRYTEPGHEFTDAAGYQAQDEYAALDPGASSVLVAPDTMGEWWRDTDRDRAGDRDNSRGPVVGALMGFLAAEVAIGVATLVAAFVRPQAAPVSAVGGVFLDRLPTSLRSHLMAHFGAHGQTVLLLGAVGFVAIVLGFMARRNPSVGVAGIAALGLLGAFVAVTRPESRASDVIPSAIGALAGIVALLWLAHASAPVAPLGPAYGSGRRRAR
jgi:hypothetical protein